MSDAIEDDFLFTRLSERIELDFKKKQKMLTENKKTEKKKYYC